MEFHIYRKSEQELIEGCRRHDATAQQALFNKYAAKMKALSFRYVKDQMEAEDVLIKAFMKVFEKIDQYKSEGSFEGWIRRIVVNESLTILRKKRSMFIETELEVADREPDFSQLSTHLEAEELLNMIAGLPPGYRIVFNMYAIDGYSHKEIAEHLGISEGTSKSQLSRARTMLQGMLMTEENQMIKRTEKF
ncbi:MAG TPA: RNA polymerase sigma factor [Cyclobacteriaceae bacterium]|nr:RNA polymerase sigma factor [Cyclobacteriaceae bacterium]